MTVQIDTSLLSAPLLEGDSCLIGKFQSMGSPCEILIDSRDPVKGRQLLERAIEEARRIERKFSRYQKGNVVDQINTSQGKRMKVDEETSHLLDFARACFDMSGGLFDITTGVLRKVWRFEGHPQTVRDEDLARILPLVGWSKLTWERPFLELPAGMEIDFGGICKEYAADRILDLLTNIHPIGLVVNLGGDVAAQGDRLWSVGIEDVNQLGKAVKTVTMAQGALATSGTMRRYTIINGKRYGHILNPLSGWPVQFSPRSVTVAASTCTEAGFFSTLAMLHGSKAEAFLMEQNLRFWSYR